MASREVFPPLPFHNKLPGVHELCLYSGAKFKGEKRWRKGRQEMEVELKHVDRDNELVYGILTLKGSHNHNRGMETKAIYFEGEIIGSKHSFITRKWFADSDTDRKHWWKFDCFYKFAQVFNPDIDKKPDSDCLMGRDHVYMRWKETECKENSGFVAPGFYYVCLTKSMGTVEGIYYEHNCDVWNEDTFFLKHVAEKGLPVFQFR